MYSVFYCLPATAFQSHYEIHVVWVYLIVSKLVIAHKTPRLLKSFIYCLITLPSPPPELLSPVMHGCALGDTVTEYREAAEIKKLVGNNEISDGTGN